MIELTFKLNGCLWNRWSYMYPFMPYMPCGTSRPYCPPSVSMPHSASVCCFVCPRTLCLHYTPGQVLLSRAILRQGLDKLTFAAVCPSPGKAPPFPGCWWGPSHPTTTVRPNTSANRGLPSQAHYSYLSLGLQGSVGPWAADTKLPIVYPQQAVQLRELQLSSMSASWPLCGFT